MKDWIIALLVFAVGMVGIGVYYLIRKRKITKMVEEEMKEEVSEDLKEEGEKEDEKEE